MTDPAPAGGPTLEQYRVFFDGAASPAWLFDERSRRVVAVNHAAVIAYGFSRDEWLAQPIDDAVMPEDRAALRSRLRRSKAATAADQWRVRTKAGGVVDVQVRWARVTGAARVDGLAMAWVVASSAPAPDVATAGAFEAAPVALVALSRRGVVLRANRTAGDLLACDAATLTGTTFTDVALPGAPAEAETLADALARGARWRGTWVLGARGREPREVEGRMEPGPAGGVHVLALHDVSGHVKAADTLRRSNDRYRRLTDHGRRVREEERARLSRDLHDRLGQALSSLKMDLAWLLALTDRFEPSTARSAIAGMMARVDTTIASVRRIAGDLRPGVLDRLGLPAAVEWQATEFERRSGVRCRVAVADDCPALGRQAATEVFRIVQEILTNVSRHAAATRVRIAVTGERGRFTLRVYDNGRGIPREAIDSEHSLGLIGMRERATVLGGTFTISQGRRRGTLAVLRLPPEPRLVTPDRRLGTAKRAGTPAGRGARPQ